MLKESASVREISGWYSWLQAAPLLTSLTNQHLHTRE